MHVDQWFLSPFFHPPSQVFYSYYKVNNTLNKFSHCMLLFIVSETPGSGAAVQGERQGIPAQNRQAQEAWALRWGTLKTWGKKGYAWPCDTGTNLALSCWHLSTYYFPMTPWFTYSENSKDSHCSARSDGYREDLFWGVYSSLTEGDQKHQPEKCLNASAVSTTIEERPLQNKASTGSPHYDLTKFTG